MLFGPSSFYVEDECMNNVECFNVARLKSEEDDLAVIFVQHKLAVFGVFNLLECAQKTTAEI